MINWLDKINNAWTDLLNVEPISRQYRTKLLSPDVPLDILAGIRAIDNAPCLILQTLVAHEDLFEVGGMRLQLIPDNSGVLLVLSLEDESRRDLFSTICADVVSAAANNDEAEARDRFITRLDAWRKFLRDRRSGLSQSETTGLIGELLILDRLLSINPRFLSCWEAPKDGLHDFYFDGHALEAKTTLGPASSITISKLDQLDTTGLRRLDLLYVRMIETPDGQSLQNIIDRVIELLPDEATKHIFRNALLSRGLMPDDHIALSTPKIAVRTIDAFTVSDNFPRLLRTSIPVAITEATYRLELRSLTPFSADTNATIDTFMQRDLII